MRQPFSNLLTFLVLCWCTAYASPYLECFQARVALFKPVETDPALAKIFARARLTSIGVPEVKTYSLGNKKDSLVVTWAFISQEDYTLGLLNPTGKIRIDIEIKNYTSGKLRVMMSQGSLVDGDGNSYPISSANAASPTYLQPNAKATYDITSYVRDELGSKIMLLHTFTVYLDVLVGDATHTLEQKFERIPWSEGEPLSTTSNSIKETDGDSDTVGAEITTATTSYSIRGTDNGYKWNKTAYAAKIGICADLARRVGRRDTQFYYDALEAFYNTTDPKWLNVTIAEAASFMPESR